MNNLKYTARRNKLVEELRAAGITDEKVLNAIKKVPRHIFFDETLIEYAYVDKAFPIASGQTISQPFTVALQTQLLDIKPNEKVLEIGTGSGYQCAVLIEMGAKVFSIERQEKLFNQTYKLMSSLHYLPKLFFGDGYKGCKTYAPFDKIIITAAPEALPEELLHQLVVGGIMVCPVGIEKEQDMLKITRISETEYKTEKLGKCAFVPMLQGVN